MTSATLLGELLRGPLASDSGDSRPWQAALEVQLEVDDWQALWRGPGHEVTVPAFDAGRPPGAPNTCLRLSRPGQAQPELWESRGGRVSFFEQPAEPLCRLSRLAARAALRIVSLRPGGWRGTLTWPCEVKGVLRGIGARCRAAWQAHAELRRLRRTHKVLKALVAPLWLPVSALWWASRGRRFDYRLQFERAGRLIVLEGTKSITALPGWSDVAKALCRRLRGQQPAPLRTPWEQLTQLDVVLSYQTGPDAQGALWLDPPARLRGRLEMDIAEMVRRHAPQVRPWAGLVPGLAGLASFALLVLRDLARAHLLDLLPSPAYPEGLPSQRALPSPSAEPARFLQPYPSLQEADGSVVLPQLVPLQAGAQASAPGGAEQVELALIRYRPRRLQARFECGEVRHRSIVLMNGFAQNTLPFVAAELGPDALAARLLREGWDVWLFEYRVSPMLQASARFSSMDDIAACDIPAAVRKVLATLRADPEAPPEARDHREAPHQIALFSHCVGSAALEMSLLGGHLRERSDGTGRSLLHAVLFSQFLPRVVGSKSAQMRLGVASLLRNLLGLDYIEFTAGAVQSDLLHQAADRLFRLMPVEPGEQCPAGSGHPAHAHTTCRRMTGFLSPLYRHDQLLPETHARLDTYFGRTNLGVFIHGTKCVSGERIVNAHGQGVYLTDDNIRTRLDMPVMLMQGEVNQLFDIESLDNSARDLHAVFGAVRAAQGYDRFERLEGFAHFDCTIGRRAPADVFPKVSGFFDRAWRRSSALAPAPPQNRLRARVPRTGPITGWSRLGAVTGVRRVCLWAELDTAGRERPVGLLLRARFTPSGGGAARESFSFWPAHAQPLPDIVTSASGGTGQPNALSVRHYDRSLVIGRVWVEVPPGEHLEAELVGLHVYTDDGAGPRQGREVVVHTGDGAGQVPGEPPELLRVVCPEAAVDAGLGGANGGPAQADVLGPQANSMVDPVLGWALLEACRRRIEAHNAAAQNPAATTLSRERRSVVLLPADTIVRLAARPSAQPCTRLALTSCRYPGLTVFERDRSDATLGALAARQQQATADGAGLDAVWMLGDQVYVDATAGLLDASSPLERHLPVYREAFGSTGFRTLARQVPLYMVSDDHEVGDEWTADQLRWSRAEAVNARMAHACEEAFQRCHGPRDWRLSGDAAFEIAGLPFYRLDTRWKRSRVGRRLLTEAQWVELGLWLQQQVGREGFKFIATGSVIAPGIDGGSGVPGRAPPRDRDNWQLSPGDRARLLGLISRLGVRNLVFLSGDYHCAAVAEISLPSKASAWSLVAPPLHAPLPFANLPASLLTGSETIPLGGMGSATATLLGAVHAQTAPDGWMEIEVCSQTQTLRVVVMKPCAGATCDARMLRSPCGRERGEILLQAR